MEEGKLEQATKLSGKLSGARGELTETLYLGSPRDGYSRLDAMLPVALRTGDGANVLTMLETASRPTLENLKSLAVEGVRDGNAGGADERSGCGVERFDETRRRALAYFAASKGRPEEKERTAGDTSDERGDAGCPGRPVALQSFDHVFGVEGGNPCGAEAPA
jgi:hypothetical protein